METMKVDFKYTEYYAKENVNRENVIQTQCGGDGNVIAKFYWDRNHANGAEWHYLTNHGIIIIVNVNTNLVCTKLIARPAQLTRYRGFGMKNELNKKTMNMRNWIVPSGVLKVAALHEKMGLNLT